MRAMTSMHGPSVVDESHSRSRSSLPCSTWTEDTCIRAPSSAPPPASITHGGIRSVHTMPNRRPKAALVLLPHPSRPSGLHPDQCRRYPQGVIMNGPTADSRLLLSDAHARHGDGPACPATGQSDPAACCLCWCSGVVLAPMHMLGRWEWSGCPQWNECGSRTVVCAYVSLERVLVIPDVAPLVCPWMTCNCPEGPTGVGAFSYTALSPYAQSWPLST